MLVVNGILRKIKPEDVIDGEITLQDNIKSIGSWVLLSNNTIRKINIPDSVEEILKDAFNGCSSLAEVNVSDTVMELYNTFQNCKNLTKVNLPKKLKILGQYTFSGCESIKEITLPEGVEVIGEKAFFSCSKLEDIVLPESLKEIGPDAFKKCEKLKELNIPKKVKVMALDAISMCKALKKLSFNQKTRFNGELEDYSFKCMYLLKNGTMVLEDEIPEIKDIKYAIDFQDYQDFDLSYILNSKEKTSIMTLLDKVKKNKINIPIGFAKQLDENKMLKSFIENSNFKFFRNENPNLSEELKKTPLEEQLDFYKFANAIGCFSTKKVVDKNGVETETTLAQKSSSLLAQLLKHDGMKLRKIS